MSDLVPFCSLAELSIRLFQSQRLRWQHDTLSETAATEFWGIDRRVTFVFVTGRDRHGVIVMARSVGAIVICRHEEIRQRLRAAFMGGRACGTNWLLTLKTLDPPRSRS